MKTSCWFLYLSVWFTRAVEETCLLNNDGSCLSEELPPIVDQYMDIGYGDKQHVTGTEEAIQGTMKQMLQMVHYMEGTVMTDPSFADVKTECVNQHELCVYWVSSQQIHNLHEFCVFLSRKLIFNRTQIIGFHWRMHCQSKIHDRQLCTGVFVV